MLELTDLHVYYGRVHALKGVSIEVPDKAIVSLLGNNGAGKSTLLKTISRLLPLTQGTYKLNEESMLKKSAADVVRMGVIHCPEGRKIFTAFTVEENLKVGAYLRKDNKEIRKDMEKVLDYFPRLRERLHQKAATLSGGEQQMLAIARSLMGDPKILLLDEPSLGIAPILIEEIFHIIRTINRDGISILLVEQNASLALNISNYAYVLENGRVALEGESAVLKNNDKVRELYLGG